MSEKRILILGVGNILLGDEGAGVHAVRKLQAEHVFPYNVRLMDGGTLGLALMEHLLECDLLIVLDAVRGGGAPGTVYRLEDEGLRKSLGFSDSLHQLDLVDTLNLCELSMGSRPRALVFGLEPGNMRDLSLDLTPAAQAGLPRLCAAVLEELKAQGCAVAGAP